MKIIEYMYQDGKIQENETNEFVFVQLRNIQRRMNELQFTLNNLFQTYNDSKSKDVSEKLELNEKLILNSVNELCLIIKNYVDNVTKSKDYCELSSFISQINEKANSEVD